MNKLVLEKSKTLMMDFLKNHNRYRFQPMLKFRNVYRRINNFQIRMKGILTMYREVEENMIDQVVQISDVLRRNIIQNKALEKRYGSLLHEIGQCIFKSSDILKIIVKE